MVSINISTDNCY